MNESDPQANVANLSASAPGNSLDGRPGLQKALAYYSPYGWRGRIGLISPSTNTTVEREMAMMAPSGVTVHTSRVHQSGGQEPASYRRMADDIGHAAGLLRHAEIDVITFACTSCTYFVPPEEVARTMADSADCPAILVADAVFDALRAVGAERIALITPRTAFVTERETALLAAEGFTVSACLGLGLGVDEMERRAIGRVPPETLIRMAAGIGADVDAVFISCTQLATLPVIEQIETMLSLPVVTSNQATMWSCLRTIGIRDPQHGFGTLLARH